MFFPYEPNQLEAAYKWATPWAIIFKISYAVNESEPEALRCDFFSEEKDYDLQTRIGLTQVSDM